MPKRQHAVAKKEKLPQEEIHISIFYFLSFLFLEYTGHHFTSATQFRAIRRKNASKIFTKSFNNRFFKGKYLKLKYKLKQQSIKQLKI